MKREEQRKRHKVGKLRNPERCSEQSRQRPPYCAHNFVRKRGSRSSYRKEERSNLSAAIKRAGSKHEDCHEQYATLHESLLLDIYPRATGMPHSE